MTSNISIIYTSRPGWRTERARNDLTPGIVFQLELDTKRYLWFKSGMAYIGEMIRNLKPYKEYSDPKYNKFITLEGAIKYQIDDLVLKYEELEEDHFDQNMSFNELLNNYSNNNQLHLIKKLIIELFGEVDCY
jgi:hypothetical protein